MWFWIFAVIFAGFAFYLVYSGLLFRVEIKLKEEPLDGELEIYYKVGRGSYSSRSDYYDEMKDIAAMATRIGIFYDNPKVVRTSNLRWIVGVITAINGKKLVNDYVQVLLVQNRCLAYTIPQVQKAMVADHLFKNSFSLWLARMKMYSKVQQFHKDTSLAGRPIIEILRQDRIQFIIPLQNHDSYTVPELRCV